MSAEIEDEAEGDYEPGLGLMNRQDGKMQLCASQCATCVGLPGNQAKLRPGRLKDLVNSNIGDGRSGLVCHETLRYGQHPEQGEALCRWFRDTFGHLSNGIRIQERLGGFHEITLPGMEEK